MERADTVIKDPTYRIDSEIGSGGGGVVYKAWHIRLQKYFVIKELKGGSAEDIETQRNEVEALKDVKSDFLPQVLDFITEDNRVFTVMEFIEGESLDKLLARGQKFTQPQVRKWYGQLASALVKIHEKNICHRDIKPANIMLMPNGNICLIDFNAALVSGNDVRLISRSLGYASPEQYEIYERYKNGYSAPINYGNSASALKSPKDADTEQSTGDLKTEILKDDNQKTEFLNEKTTDTQKTEVLSSLTTDGIDWKRSDIFSLGATMCHLLTGKHPHERVAETIPVSKLRRFSDGMIFVVEQSMRPNPSERFASVTLLSEAVRNIHKIDADWKVLMAKTIAAAVIIPLALGLFTATALFGRSVMAQEKEERYYSAVHNIENGADVDSAYQDALAMFWDRIDPYYAMAKRLWNDGDINACQSYIEENLGNIAEFQSVPTMRRQFGDIYYILGNCYYYKSGEPDYNMAKGNFEIAVQFVKDNPVYYRDYAISLARTGYVEDAERVLEKAQVLNLDADSLNLLNGEIGFAKQEYDDSAENLGKVISTATDEYMRYRAYHSSNEIFRLLGQPERSAELLESAMNRIPLNRVAEMTERLADAYVKGGNYEKAIRLFEQLSETGAPQFHIMQNLAVLYQNIGEIDRAADTLASMSDAFPNDYRVPMRQAYLEADRQSKIENESRDYALTKQYYDTATALYTENVTPGESDPEMHQLDALIERQRRHKWIN